jgi:hypothetical protein
MLKRNQQIEVVSEFAFNQDRSTYRRVCEADTNRTYGPVASGRIVVDFIS